MGAGRTATVNRRREQSAQIRRVRMPCVLETFALVASQSYCTKGLYWAGGSSMQITDDWRERLARTYLPFATWTTLALVTIVPGALSPLTGETGACMVLIAFLCASPAMISARLTIALSRFVRTGWQLPVLSAGCGFVTVIGFAAAYLLSIVVASWAPVETAAIDVVPVAKAVTVSGILLGSLSFLIPAAAGGLVSSTSAGLWLCREWHVRKGRGAGKEVTGISPPAPDAGFTSGQMRRNRRTASEACFFWCTTAYGPLVVTLPLALLVPPNSGQQLLLLLYFGTFAAAVTAALVLTLVFNRRRRSAWPVALCVGLHAGAMFSLLFAPTLSSSETLLTNPAFLMLFGSVIGALSAAVCTAFWFPDRRGQALGSAEVELNGWALMRPLIVAGFIAPLAAALAYGLFVALMQLAGTSPDSTFIGRLRSFDPWIWSVAYRVWAVVALQALALRHLLPMADIPRSLAIGITLVLAFLLSGGMGHSLDDHVMQKSTVVSLSSFLELALSGLVAAFAALYAFDRDLVTRRAVDARNAAA